jgi:uncharacterized protein YpuA (DUF1002 family)
MRNELKILVLLAIALIVTACVPKKSGTEATQPQTQSAVETAQTQTEIETQRIAEESLGGTTWTYVKLSGDPVPPDEWQFFDNGKLSTHDLDSSKNTWTKNGSSVVVSINDNFLICTLQIIDSNLMIGNGKNRNGVEWEIKLKKGSIEE